jgi:NAD(P)-dependent dehydrogenase (short-subunit alcohol dehydrogenase family)
VSRLARRLPIRAAILTGYTSTGGLSEAEQMKTAWDEHQAPALLEEAGRDTAENASQGIRINTICPGIIDTDMMRRFTGDTDEGRAAVIAQEPIGRMGRPEEIAAAVLWLCSNQATFIIGHAMVVDGGQTA